MIPVTYGTIPVHQLDLNESETARRLQVEKNYKNELINQCLDELKGVVNCKFSAVLSSVSHYENGFIDIGFGKFQSHALSENLKDCNKAYIFAVTLGLGVDRLLNKYSLTSPAGYFILDGLSSSMAEAATDKAEKNIRGSFPCRPRFSPGYGDLPLEIQPDILRLLNAEKLLGITINNALLMSPKKSVTAIMGIKNE